MKQRNIILAIVLTIVTCGIYGIYWFIKMTDETNALANPAKPTSGVMAAILTLVTCGLYGIYWAYKMGLNLDLALEAAGRPAQGRSILYLVLQLVGLGIVNYVLFQNELNSLLPEA